MKTGPWTSMALGGLVTLAGCSSGAIGATAGPTPAATPGATPLATAAAPARVTPSPAPTYPANMLDRPDFSPVEPGTYYVEPDGLPVRVLYTVPESWNSWIGAYRTEVGPEGNERHIGLTVINVTNLVVHGCTDHAAQDPPVGPTVENLAAALAALPPFELKTPPREVVVDSIPGQYLEITSPGLPTEVPFGETKWKGCLGGELKSFIGPPLSYAYYGYEGVGQVEAFRILDVEGGRLVIESTWSPDSPNIEELQAVLDSIQIEPIP